RVELARDVGGQVSSGHDLLFHGLEQWQGVLLPRSQRGDRVLFFRARQLWIDSQHALRRSIVSERAKPAQRQAAQRLVGEQIVQNRCQVVRMFLDQRFQRGQALGGRRRPTYGRLAEVNQRLRIAEDQRQNNTVFPDGGIVATGQANIEGAPAV